MSKNVMGVNIDPSYSIIRPYHPVGWVPLNPFEKHIYQLPHIGDVYNRDKKMVWGKILKAPSNTPSWEWIK